MEWVMVICHENVPVQTEGSQVSPIVLMQNCIQIVVTFCFCKYIAFTSDATHYLYWRKRSKTLINLFMKLGPLKHWLLKLTPILQHNQIRSSLFPVFQHSRHDDGANSTPSRRFHRATLGSLCIVLFNVFHETRGEPLWVTHDQRQ